MDLTTEVKKKNNQLTLQTVELQRHLCERVNYPRFRSFLTTFVVAPFMVGAASRLLLGAKGVVPHHFPRAALLGLKLWPLLRVTA